MLLIAADIPELRSLGEAWGADFVAVPDTVDPAELERWRAEVGDAEPVDRIAVAVWRAEHRPVPFCEMDAEEFTARAERTFAQWYAALGAAARRVADVGAIVAVAERPSPLDCAGWAPESGMADAVEAFVRSLARSEGPRGVRVNAVTTPARFVSGPVVSPSPPLPSFPGTIDSELAAAGAMLLGPGVVGVTGTVVHADAGRSWR